MDRDRLNMRAADLIRQMLNMDKNEQVAALCKMDAAAWGRAIFDKDQQKAKDACDALTVALDRGEQCAKAMDDHDDDEAEDPSDFYDALWDDYSGGMHDDDAPEGAYQTCYWTDGVLIERTKVKGVWKYDSTEE